MELLTKSVLVTVPGHIVVPCFLPVGHYDVTSHLTHFALLDAHDVETGLHLLSDQRLGRGHEDDFPPGEPAVEVVHHHGGDESFAQARWKTHQSVVEKARSHDVNLAQEEKKTRFGCSLFLDPFFFFVKYT